MNTTEKGTAMVRVGIDIGTTTVSAAVVSTADRKLICSFTLPNRSVISAKNSNESLQSPQIIWETAQALIERVRREFPGIRGIGLTGQMHGILYVNKNGEAVSPLYTWQDRRAERTGADGVSALRALSEATGYRVFSGYGMATHLALQRAREIPCEATSFCTIADYIGMQLTGAVHPAVHPTNAASLGVFDLKKGCFDSAALERAGIDSEMIPRVYRGEETIGEYCGIPVWVAIGDNQASFLGAVGKSRGTLLVNIGTGSQVSAVCGYTEALQKCELRPFVGGDYLAVGAALCGGRAYATLERFFRSFAERLGCRNADIYGILDSLAEEATSPLAVDTRFAGTRNEPALRGSIREIDTERFTPANLAAGFLHGMVGELMELYEDMRQAIGGCRRLVGSGNGYRKNPVLQNIIRQSFALHVHTCQFEEEAACGAAFLA